jgi:ribosome-associated protein
MRSFILKNDYIELVKFIKLLGFAKTGGQASLMIQQGGVLLNGKTELRKRAKLRQGDVVEISNEEIQIIKSG